MTFATDIFDGDGSQTEFELTFDYIERDHVKVYRVAADESETQLTVVTDGSALGDDDYKWETDKKVKLGKAPASTEKCKVVRETPEDRQLVQWKDGSYIVAEDLNTSDKQFLYIDQEHDDRIETLEGFVPTVEKAAITESEAEKDPDDPAWSGDERIATVGAIDRIYSNVVGSGSSYPGTGNKGKLGKLRLDNTTTPAKMFWWDASLSTPAWVELKVEGKKGDKGIQVLLQRLRLIAPSRLILATTPRSRTPARPAQPNLSSRFPRERRAIPVRTALAQAPLLECWVAQASRRMAAVQRPSFQLIWTQARRVWSSAALVTLRS